MSLGQIMIPHPCNCEHSRCTHPYMSVPSGEAAAMFIGPICDECIPHMEGYLLTSEEAELIRKEVLSYEASSIPTPREVYSLSARRTV